MTNPKTKTNALLSPKPRSSHSRTPSTDSSGKKSFFRDIREKFRSKSPTPSGAVKTVATATLTPNSLQGIISAFRSSPNMSIATASSGVSTGQAAFSTGNVSTNLATLSVGSGHGLASTSPASSVPRTTGVVALTPRPDIFPKNGIVRVNIDISAPKIGHDFESTAQLTICVGILNKVFQVSASLSSASSQLTASVTGHAIFSSLSASQQEWILEMERNPIERQYVYQITDHMINQFVSDDLKGSESIREIVLLGPVLNVKSYRNLLDCFRRRLDGSTLLDIDDLLGLVQLIQAAPIGYLVADDLNQILLRIRVRLEASSQLSKNVKACFVLVIAMVLILLVPCRVTGLSHEEEYEPLLKLLLELRENNDPLVKYQADYACQSLLLVPDDETSRQEFCRHLIGLSSGLLKMSGIARLEFNGIVEGLPDTIKGARGMFGFLKKMLGSGDKAPWFSAIRMAEGHVRNGDFFSLKAMVCDPRHYQDSKFLWGITQLLGEIAADPSWDVASREQAVEFLSELFEASIESNQDDDQDIPRWILTVLAHLSDLSVSDSSDTANSVLKISHVPIKAKAQALFVSLNRSRGNEFDYLHPLRISLPVPKASLLLKDANDHPDLDHAIYKYQNERQSEFNAQSSIFIPPMSKVSLVATDENPVELLARTQEFLEGSAQVILILGDSGAGKSTFNRHLENGLWNKYKPKESRIPLFINLPEIENPKQDMIDKQLRIYKFSESHIKELKAHRRLLLICDGYDEAQLNVNLHTTNLLDKTGHLDVKMMVSCRSTFVGQDYSDLFSPQTRDRYQANKSDQYTEAVIIPFSEEQIEDYVRQFVRDSEAHKLADEWPFWSTTDYMDKLRSIPKLLELVKNPFLLSLSLRAIPSVVRRASDVTNVKVTRLTLYDSFIDDWVEKSRLRLRRTILSGEINTAFEILLKYGFGESVVDFSKNLAAAIYHQHNGNPVVEYRPKCNQTTWKCEFFGPASEKTLLLESSPLSRVHDQYRFMHQSLLEYFYSRYVFETSAGSNVESQALEDISSHPLSKRHLIKESSILQFLAEYVQAHPVFKERLDHIIERSKTDVQASQAAANAITILVRAGIRFHRADLRGIQIPGADLSYGQFDSAQLQGSDLRTVNLCSVWLRQANLSNTQMAGVHFGEWPFLEEISRVSSCAFSQDGETFAVSLMNGVINLYDTATWEIARTFSALTRKATSVAFSPSGRQIVSCCEKGELCIWEAQTGELGAVLRGNYYGTFTGSLGIETSRDFIKRLELRNPHTAPGATLTVSTRSMPVVAFSPSGEQIASGSDDNTVQLWDALTGTPSAILSGHTDLVVSVMFSLNGQQIVSGSNDKTVRLWDAQTCAPGPILSGHTKRVMSVAFSPSSHQIASGSDDKTVRLWDAQTGATVFVLSGHTNTITSVVFSPSGKQIASGSADNMVRLWNVQTGASDAILSGHTRAITKVVFSPSGHQISSSSEDMTVRLWDAQTSASSASISRHSGYITSVVISPSGQQIASSSGDTTVRLWDTETGATRAILSGHTKRVMSVVFSPNSHRIASGSGDETVRLWDAQTGASVFVLSGHTNTITSVVFSPSGQQIASGSADNTLRLWDVKSGACLTVVDGLNGIVGSIFWSASENGRYFATGCHDTSVCLWHVIEEGGYHVHLCWSSVCNRLNVSNTSILNAQGLSSRNMKLLKQRGAVRNPISMKVP